MSRRGKRANLRSCLALTLFDHLCVLDFDGDKILFTYKFGLDGGGLHRDIKHKKGAVGAQIMVSFFVLLSIEKEDGTVLYDASEIGANSHKVTRPVAVFPAKETDDVVREFTRLLEAEKRDVDEDPIEVVLPGGHKVMAACKKGWMTMLDGRMLSRLLGVNAAYCTMCHYSQVRIV